MGDLNMEPRSNNLYNLIKSNTCFKGKGSRTDFFGLTRNIHLRLMAHVRQLLVISIA